MDERDARGPMQEHAGEDEPGQLTKQTPGLDEGEISAIAGPDWDPDLVKDSRDSMDGEPIEGEIERGDAAGGANRGG